MKWFFRRLYKPIAEKHFRQNRQMLFLMGPRQVGKTSLCLEVGELIGSDCFYLNWDNLDHRGLLIKGPRAIAEHMVLNKPRENPPVIIFDEIHKYKEWKTLLKGFFDTYADQRKIFVIVTGSARLDVYNHSGDSLMGRYLRFRIHPFSVSELLKNVSEKDLYSKPCNIPEEQFKKLYELGGFPEPYIKGDLEFYEQWKGLRLQQLFQEEIRELTRIHQLKQMELLALQIKNQVGALTSYTTLSKNVRVSIETVKRWVKTLHLLYYCFSIQPWSKNVVRSLLKEPKFYLWDWSQIEDKGAKAENFIASHLLKACHFWTDRGLGIFELYFLRDKEKREVDFLVSKNSTPWFLVEVKLSEGPLSKHLEYYQKQTKAKHAFQVIVEGDYEEIDCFQYSDPIIVSAKTLLSQLV